MSYYSSYAIFKNKETLKKIARPLLKNYWHFFPNEPVELKLSSKKETVICSKAEIEKILEKDSSIISIRIGHHFEFWQFEDTLYFDSEDFDYNRKDIGNPELVIAFDMNARYEHKERKELLKRAIIIHQSLLEPCEAVFTLTSAIHNNVDGESYEAALTIANLIERKNFDSIVEYIEKSSSLYLLFGFQKLTPYLAEIESLCRYKFITIDLPKEKSFHFLKVFNSNTCSIFQKHDVGLIS